MSVPIVFFDMDRDFVSAGCGVAVGYFVGGVVGNSIFFLWRAISPFDQETVIYATIIPNVVYCYFKFAGWQIFPARDEFVSVVGKGFLEGEVS